MVPAVGAALYPATFLVLQVLDQINYRHSGLCQILFGWSDRDERPSRHLEPGPAI